MNEILVLVITMMSGSVLGVFYFGGLWFTLKHLPGSQQPALLALSGFLVRSLVCLFVFYLISSNGWEGTVSSLVGFTLAKLAMTDRLGHIEYKEAG
jgi:F1F0 ATPase subunit 2